jgi:hypothetical protein
MDREVSATTPVGGASRAVSHIRSACSTKDPQIDSRGLHVKIETPDVLGERIRRRETAIWHELIRQRNITAN